MVKTANKQQQSKLEIPVKETRNSNTYNQLFNQQISSCKSHWSMVAFHYTCRSKKVLHLAFISWTNEIIIWVCVAKIEEGYLLETIDKDQSRSKTSSWTLSRNQFGSQCRSQGGEPETQDPGSSWKNVFFADTNDMSVSQGFGHWLEYESKKLNSENLQGWVYLLTYFVMWDLPEAGSSSQKAGKVWHQTGRGEGDGNFLSCSSLW